MEIKEVYMQRAFELAGLGRGWVSPNPMVGCVIVAGGEIIGEGWHRNYGDRHAEVEAVNDAVQKGLGGRLAGATAYVTLEPCSHFGKTPPCADLLISEKIKNVVVSNTDPNPLVSGRGLSKLAQAGIGVATGILEGTGEELNKRFFLGMRSRRPYVILKWAQTRDGFLGMPGQRVKISNPLTDLVVHQWRSEEDAILVGKNTVLADNPMLNVRGWTGRDPVRVVLDRHLATARPGFHVFNKSQPTLFVNTTRETVDRETLSRYRDTPDQGFDINYLKVPEEGYQMAEIAGRLYEECGICSVLVEGGRTVIEAFLAAGIWDEIRTIRGDLILGEGIAAPQPGGILSFQEEVGPDTITYYLRSTR